MSRVLLINVTCGSGSTGKIVTGIYDNLVAHGHECMIAYGRYSAPRGYNAYRIGSDLDVNVHGVLSRITDKQGLYSKQATKKFIKKIEEFNPDVVHMHNIHGYYVNYKILFEYLRKSNRRVIWTLHDCWSLTGHCTHFEYIGCDKYKDRCYRCAQLKEYPKSYLCDASTKNHELKKELFSNMNDMVLVTPSSWLKDIMLNSYMGKYSIKVIPTGIDLSIFKPQKANLRTEYGLDGKIIILGVANPWRERKGLFEFNKLCDRLDDSYKIVLIGLNEDQKKLVDGRIVALGKTENVMQMAQWYSTADVYVNLTLEDTFPTTNIESLACGTPVITYDVGGSKESLSEKTGFVAKANDIAAVVDYLGKIKTGIIDSSSCIEQAALYSKELRFEQYYKDVYEAIL